MKPRQLKPNQVWLFLSLMIAVCSFSGCQTLNLGQGLRDKLIASNDRDWKPELATVPFAEVAGLQYTLRNIRNCSYVTAEDFVVNYYDRQISLDQIQSVDFIVVPFAQTAKLAHTMLSFGLNDGSYLALSIEVRKEQGEEFNPVLGVGKTFELIYVLGDERDVIRLRTKHRDSDVYVYPTVADVQQSQALFVDVIKRMNKLASEPEFYNSISNNCTTNIAGHVNAVSPSKINWGWKVLLPGFSAEYAYELGLLDNRIPFEDLTQIAMVNRLADKHFEAPDFSQKIRSRRYQLERAVERQNRREPTLRSRGEEYLEAQTAHRSRAFRNNVTERPDLPGAIRSAGQRLRGFPWIASERNLQR